ncbi:aromatic amino acid lyase [Acidaminococcus massiliensis]|jgi:histidine ammonia-lyase|uniref:aromatic amino acid lyase n=1 Tax=Acidaminococcus massiliensis TaxID=1852375 RepID=UPI00266BD3B5|nr:aromatic amino acid lyase [Acidaminococcus massiliensis]
MMTNVFACREIAKGKAEGEILLSSDQILFYHVRPEDGVVMERGHCLEGISVKDKILIFPGGKGSSVVQMDGLYQLEKHGTAPRAFIVEEPDTVLVSTAIIMDVPMVDRVEHSFYREIHNGDIVRLDTTKQTIEIEERGQRMEKILLNGHELTLQALYHIAYEGYPVEIEAEAWKRVKRGRETMERLAHDGKAIYGYNRGVGWNKDRNVEENLIEKENRKVIYSHALGYPPYNTIEEVRAMMAIRLNTLLIGASCASDELVILYKEFLNRGITPCVPRRGSVGEADITTITHIGMAFAGENQVYYKGQQTSAREAMKQEGLEPYHWQLKDAHTVMLSNSQGEGTTAILVKEVEDLLFMSDLVYCLDYEGLNGNIEAMRQDVNELRGLPGQKKCAARCRKFLEGSYLYDKDSKRALQDSLSFRGGFTITGTVIDALEVVKKFLAIQINSPSDNPCIIPATQELYVTSNFETTSLAVAVEMLSIALGHLSRTINYRMIKMADPDFTGLTRFLAPRNGESYGYSQIQDAFSALDAENRFLITPSSVDFFAIEGYIEDHASNLPLVTTKALQLVDNLRYLVGMEALYAAQAVDLRGNIRLGRYTQAAYDTIRKIIPSLDGLRPIQEDVQKAYTLIKSGKLLENLDDLAQCL